MYASSAMWDTSPDMACWHAQSAKMRLSIRRLCGNPTESVSQWTGGTPVCSRIRGPPERPMNVAVG
eukprot:546448-Pyramimonas_sp.AAC.1